MELKINEEFKNLIPALSDEDFAGLRQQIIDDDIIYNPIIILQDGTILDGHNRFAIATELNMPYTTLVKSFASDDEIIIYIYNIQLRRRNLSEDVRKIIIGNRYKLTKKNEPTKSPSGQFVASVNTADKNFTQKMNIIDYPILNFYKMWE